MYYTDEEFKTLSAFAEDFRRAVAENYCNHPGTPNLKAIRAAYMRASGADYYPESYGCTSCVVVLMKLAGRLWLADKAEREANAQTAADAEKAAETAKAAKSAASKTGAGKSSTKTDKAARTAAKPKSAKK